MAADAPLPRRRAGQLKSPKGTRDWTTIVIFKRHGGIHLDSPVFELQDVTEKYNEDSHLIYNLKD
ncbi:hypothetical protein EDB81DRAFT_948318 [Dactylonectria macrodidyma]|uniref:Uncharacterized protein n=1 Tax=Dactylonectria macrodidyma TaxID=307937 RepID=A0A9P9EQW2_9HYPO|nr:hypothetical protein EDB81DRAFT_948318 [Dactylonectria macrodidyma]